MATTITFDAEALEGLAADLRGRLLGVVDAPPTAKAGIAEAFELWQGDEVPPGDSRRLAEIGRAQQRFLHLIRIDGVTKAGAITRWMPDKRRLTLLSVLQSPLMPAIHEAIGIVDELGVPDAFTARLLVLTSYNVTAFWFVNETTRPPTYGQLYIIQAPREVARIGPRRLIEEEELLTPLRGLPATRGWNVKGDAAQQQ